jgi:TnpA family transposase
MPGLKDINTRIMRLELRIAQLRIHLQSLARASAEAAEVRSMLYGMLQQLASLKESREEMEAALEAA